MAFASADLLVEIDPGTAAITFAAGAGRKLTGVADDSMTGRPWRELVAEADHAVAQALIEGLEPGERRGPALIRLTADAGEPHYASFSSFHMPGNGGRVSCGLTFASRPPVEWTADNPLPDREEFERAARSLLDAARVLGPELELGLIGLGGLKGMRQALATEDARALQVRVAGALRAESWGDAAAELGDDRFAILRRKGEPPEAMRKRLVRILGEAAEPVAQSVAIDQGVSASRAMRALRFALDGFIADGGGPSAANLTAALDRSVRKTVADANAFAAMVERRDFNLVYQPVITLADGAVHHYEALVRFEGDRSPFSTIRMAEDLDLIETLDRAVAEEVVGRLQTDPHGDLRLAVNVSGRTMTSPAFFATLAGLLDKGKGAGRLMLEITESAAIDDLAMAERHIKAMRGLGVQFCLDDFGAGAASYAYLHQLSVDVVKIDGSYVRELAASGRGDTMIRHMASLCHELGVTVVAEMVETQAVEDILRRAGVDYAQGWLYGQPTGEPRYQPKPAPSGLARRRGAVEQWG
jgi:EAL domain-containing protein (putative c-di-GMP-specific phosphodiesterase class I)